ncbi:MAG: hypothetical protein IJ760_05775 [Bacteroidales bacterium]|nr:hypothetical protein [Bacteroidales bacterium]
MENKTNIHEYAATVMGGKIAQKRSFPIIGLVALAAGVALLAAMRVASMGDSLQMLALAAGIIALAVGLVLTAMGLGGAVKHYVYLPTGSRMASRTIYLSPADYAIAVEALGRADAAMLGSLHPVGSSNLALLTLRSRDGAVALLQAGSLDTGHFVPESDVLCLEGKAASAAAGLWR